MSKNYAPDETAGDCCDTDVHIYTLRWQDEVNAAAPGVHGIRERGVSARGLWGGDRGVGGMCVRAIYTQNIYDLFASFESLCHICVRFRHMR